MERRRLDQVHAARGSDCGRKARHRKQKARMVSSRPDDSCKNRFDDLLVGGPISRMKMTRLHVLFSNGRSSARVQLRSGSPIRLNYQTNCVAMSIAGQNVALADDRRFRPFDR
jgi:hypothetical protein